MQHHTWGFYVGRPRLASGEIIKQLRAPDGEKIIGLVVTFENNIWGEVRAIQTASGFRAAISTAQSAPWLTNSSFYHHNVKYSPTSWLSAQLAC